MRGFIINIRKSKNEDVIVTVLSNETVKSYWRFFGVRHSILQIGNLVDFEVKESKSNFMPQMRSLSQISFPWGFNQNRLLVWQNFIRLFEPHLKETTSISSFYYELLLESAKRWDKQNPKRLAIEAHIKLLDYEGRLYTNGFCYICEEILDDQVSLMRAFLPTHPNCIYGQALDKKSVFLLFDTQSTLYLEEVAVNNLYSIVTKGL